MIILAIDTTAKTATVSLTEDERMIGLSILNTNNTHSVTLLPTIESMLSAAKATLNDVGLLVCSAGPGSFTGVRIGAATVKGLAFANGIRCIGVSSLEALAMNIPFVSGTVCSVMDARRGQLYNALFEMSDGVLTRITPDRVITAEELKAELSERKEKIYTVGDGYAIAREALSSHDLPEIPEPLRYQNAYSVAMLGLKKYNSCTAEERERLTAAALSPVYLRASQAERERNERLKGAKE